MSDFWHFPRQPCDIYILYKGQTLVLYIPAPVISLLNQRRMFGFGLKILTSNLKMGGNFSASLARVFALGLGGCGFEP